MKTILLAIVALSISLYIAAQNNLSTSAKIVLHTIEKYQQDIADKKGKNSSELPNELSVLNINNVQYTHALIKVEQDIDIDGLKNLGVIVNTKAGDIWTVQIPISAFKHVAALKGIQYLDTGGKMKLLMDKVRAETHANAVYAGNGLYQSYFGNGVVLGVIDMGFDYTHPNFYDPVTKKSRISRIWNQVYKGNNATPPAGFNYGTEIVNVDNFIRAIDPTDYKAPANQLYLHDGTNISHGTHVAGIAGGSGLEINDKYQGIAPNTELIFVTTFPDETLASAQIIEGIQYIYNYATAIKKPAVINLSMGSPIGPHDGTSLLSQAINNLTGEGKILVSGTGNVGNSQSHLMHQFIDQDTVFTSSGNYGIVFEEVIDCWGSPHTDFSIQVKIYDNNVKIGETKFIPASNNGIFQETISQGLTTVFIDIASETINPNNNKPHIQIHIKANQSFNSLSYDIAFAANHTFMHAWSLSDFFGKANLRYISGDSKFTVYDHQTAEKVITAGAYITRDKFTNAYGFERSYSTPITIGDIGAYSSQGPTSDGRTKPDIVAPGTNIISSISSFAEDYIADIPENSEVTDIINSPINGRLYSFATATGTSMACPVVTGAVALMLQANPTLNPQQVLNILKTTAREDNFTEDIPLTGSNTWGWGKLNIYAAVSKAEEKEINSERFTLFTFPNPAHTALNITLPQKLRNQPCYYTVSSITGKLLVSNKVFSNTFSIPLDGLSKGLYLLKITGTNTSVTNKFIKQ